jgi:hypothetical protein
MKKISGYCGVLLSLFVSGCQGGNPASQSIINPIELSNLGPTATPNPTNTSSPDTQLIGVWYNTSPNNPPYQNELTVSADSELNSSFCAGPATISNLLLDEICPSGAIECGTFTINGCSGGGVQSCTYQIQPNGEAEALILNCPEVSGSYSSSLPTSPLVPISTTGITEYSNFTVTGAGGTTPSFNTPTFTPMGSLTVTIFAGQPAHIQGYNFSAFYTQISYQVTINGATGTTANTNLLYVGGSQTFDFSSFILSNPGEMSITITPLLSNACENPNDQPATGCPLYKTWQATGTIQYSYGQ